MGKARRGKEAATRATRNYSEYNSTNYLTAMSTESGAQESSTEENGEVEKEDSKLIWENHNKHALYQRAVQKPKGDISYLQKFFLNYIGGRKPLNLREDFCGTALLCAEWVRGDTRRTAIGLDLDEEALSWGLRHNVITAGSDACNRVHLFCGNVLDPLSSSQAIQADPSSFSHDTAGVGSEQEEAACDSVGDIQSNKEDAAAKVVKQFPGHDIICAFNYSCCCLQQRSDLLKYFSRAFTAISKDGGIFAMDLYGGFSSECPLKLRRRFDEFQYTWEQEDFDVITRTTKISLHFRLNGNQGVLRHAFSYHWRLWTIPEVKECLEEAGFQSVHFWIRDMPDLEGTGNDERVKSDPISKYEEVLNFSQENAWNAYVVAVAHPSS